MIDSLMRAKLAFSTVCLSHFPLYPSRTVHWSERDVQLYDVGRGVELEMAATKLPTGIFRVTNRDDRVDNSLIFDERRFYCSSSLQHGQIDPISATGFKGCFMTDDWRFVIEYQKGRLEFFDQTDGGFFLYRVAFDRRYPILRPR